MLDAIRRLPNGARFYRADLHNHTPADPGFHCLDFNLTTEEEKRTLARAYVRFAREEKKLDILGVTDHNDISWVGYIQEAARELDGELIILPGVELGANEGKRQVHFLALFDPETAPAQIDHFISSLGLLPHGRFDPLSRTPRLTQMSCRELTARIATAEDGLPGLPIAAHATRKNGMLHELEGEGRVLAYEDRHLLAIEIPGRRGELSPFVQRLVNGEENHYGHKAIACLNSSDGRGLGQTAEANRLSIGERVTRIKLSQVSVAALRQAFIDYDSRIRLEGEQVEEKYPHLVGLSIENGFLSGPPAAGQPPAPFLLHLNPNLNAVIGGRGTGKSTLLEAIRFVFDLPPRTDATAAQARGVVEVTLPRGALVRAFYEMADGSIYEIRRASGGSPEVIDLASGRPAGIPPAALLPRGVPLEVYGQKEVYEIANDVAFQLRLIDTYIAEPLREVQRRESDLLRWLEASSQAILHLQDELAESEQEMQALAAVRLELSRLEKTAGLEQLARKLAAEEEKALLQRLENEAESRLALVAGWENHPRPRPLPPAAAALPGQVDLLAQMDRLIAESLNRLQADLARVWAGGETGRAAWWEAYEAIEAGYREIVNQGDDFSTAERYFELKTRETALLETAAQRRQKQEALHERLEQRQEKLAELRDLRQNLEFGLRQEKAEQLNEALRGAVRVRLTPEGNRAAYADYLTDCFKQSRSGISRKVIDTIVEKGEDPMHLVAAIRAEQQVGAEEDEATPLAAFYGVSASYRKRLAALDEAILFELETTRIPDLPDIRLKVGEEYRSLTPPPGEPGLSTGQKCTAILSIILVERNTPLIIDQPEDDLDNAFIFSEIVQTLRREKERRQFIIATHNANIPVSGDAELILLMSADEHHGWIAHNGSIDDPQIREPVENILEGGREAFRLRQAKYGV